jgi:hypothetical protein
MTKTLFWLDETAMTSGFIDTWVQACPSSLWEDAVVVTTSPWNVQRLGYGASHPSAAAHQVTNAPAPLPHPAAYLQLQRALHASGPSVVGVPAGSTGGHPALSENLLAILQQSERVTSAVVDALAEHCKWALFHYGGDHSNGNGVYGLIVSSADGRETRTVRAALSALGPRVGWFERPLEPSLSGHPAAILFSGSQERYRLIWETVASKRRRALLVGPAEFDRPYEGFAPELADPDPSLKMVDLGWLEHISPPEFAVYLLPSCDDFTRVCLLADALHTPSLVVFDVDDPDLLRRAYRDARCKSLAFTLGGVTGVSCFLDLNFGADAINRFVEAKPLFGPRLLAQFSNAQQAEGFVAPL